MCGSRWMGFAALLLALALAGCQTTPMLVVDPQSGFTARGDRALRTRFHREVLDYAAPGEPAPRAESVDCTYALGGPCPEHADRHVLRFEIAFTAFNDSDQMWVIRGSDFDLERREPGPRTPEAESQQLADLQRAEHAPVTIATVPPGSSAQFDVPFRIEAPATVGRATVLSGVYRLSANHAGNPLLIRDVSLTEVSQGKQVARFAIGVILLIGVIGAL